MSNTTVLPTFSFDAEELFTISGFGKNAVQLEATKIAKHEGKTYVSARSFVNFSFLITEATQEEEKLIKSALSGICVFSCGNCPAMFSLEDLKVMKAAAMPLVNRYIDYLEEL